METIEKVWANFEPFARYGFNRAHAAIYGIIAYHTAYLKANYTTEYMTAVLSAEMGTPDRIAIAVAECRRMGLAVLPPDVNESELDFAFTPKGIRFGLGAVKNVGEGAVEGLIEARRSGGWIASTPCWKRHSESSAIARAVRWVSSPTSDSAASSRSRSSRPPAASRATPLAKSASRGRRNYSASISPSIRSTRSLLA